MNKEIYCYGHDHKNRGHIKLMDMSLHAHDTNQTLQAKEAFQPAYGFSCIFTEREIASFSQVREYEYY